MKVRDKETSPEYSYWRVWGVEDGEVRVARDWYFDPKPEGPQLQPQHLELLDNGRIDWRPHEQAVAIPSLPLHDFIAWLDQNQVRS